MEWLLIVAAVAGLAALAVVLVQRVVGDTSEQIAGGSARETAAKVSATQINDKARAEGLEAGADVAAVNTEYRRQCNRLRIIYSDAEITTTYTDGVLSGTAWGTEPNCAVGESGSPGSSSATAPGAPTGVAYDVGTGVLSWTAPSGTVTSYRIDCTGSACPVGSPWTATGPPHTVGTPIGSTGDGGAFLVRALNGSVQGPQAPPVPFSTP